MPLAGVALWLRRSISRFPVPVSGLMRKEKIAGDETCPDEVRDLRPTRASIRARCFGAPDSEEVSSCFRLFYVGERRLDQSVSTRKPTAEAGSTRATQSQAQAQNSS